MMFPSAALPMLVGGMGESTLATVFVGISWAMRGRTEARKVTVIRLNDDENTIGFW